MKNRKRAASLFFWLGCFLPRTLFAVIIDRDTRLPPFFLSTVSSPNEGGVVSEGGNLFEVYRTVSISANAGWYINGVTVWSFDRFSASPPVLIGGDNIEILFNLSQPDPLGELTNLTGGVYVSGDRIVIANFSTIAPGIVSQPSGQSVIVSGNVNLSVTAMGLPPLYYQWRKNGGLIVNATNANYTLFNTQPEEAGDYDVIVTSDHGSIVSSNAILVVSPPPFDPIKATYNGLFHDSGGVAHQSSGFVRITTTTKGGFSGKLQLGGTRYPLRGQFDAEGKTSITITPPNVNPLTIALQFDLWQGADKITGTVSDGTWTAELSANRNTFSKSNPAPQSGKYTVLIPGGAVPVTQPAGDGFGTLTVNSSGNVKFSGTLCDGTKVSQSAALSKQGQWPLYVSLYSGNGSITGWLTFTNSPGDNINGQVSWIRLAQPDSKAYPAGFTIETEATGSSVQP